jgi:hypothetical protein
MPMALAGQEPGTAADEPLTAEAKRVRLEKLVGELLKTNQELRFKVAELEQQTARLQRGLAQSCSGAGMLWP